jgi:hypothetical protein
MTVIPSNSPTGVIPPYLKRIYSVRSKISSYLHNYKSRSSCFDVDPFLSFVLVYIFFFLPLVLLIVYAQWNRNFGPRNSLLYAMLEHVSAEDQKVAETVRKRGQYWFILFTGSILLWFTLPFFLIMLEELLGINSRLLDLWLDYTPSMAPLVFGILFAVNFFITSNLYLKQWKKILKSRGIDTSDYDFDLSWSERLDQRNWYILARSYFHHTYPQHSSVYALYSGYNQSWWVRLLSITPQNRWSNLPAELEFDLQYAELWKRRWNMKIILSLIILTVLTVVMLLLSVALPELIFDNPTIMMILFILFFVIMGVLMVYTGRFEIRSDEKINSILVQNGITSARNLEQKLIQLIEENFDYRDLSPVPAQST